MNTTESSAMEQDSWISNNATHPALTANLVCRLLFAIVGTLLCWIPLRQLLRKGETAAVILIFDVAFLNLFTILNSLIWRDDDWDKWYDGRVLCDLEVWLQAPLQTIYAAAIFTIMRNLALQIGQTRVMSLDAKEKRRRHLLQALIIFPFPAVQFVLSWFVLAQRYVIGTLVGCSATYDDSWPKLVFFILPPALYSVATIPYAFLTWRRFRRILKETGPILGSNGMSTRSQRQVRRRLYRMAMSIVVPYVPLMIAFLVRNIKDADLHAYDYEQIRGDERPFPWNSTMFIPSWLIPFEILNQPWIPILTTIPIFMFFGTTQDALHNLKNYSRALGLDSCLTHVKQAYKARATNKNKTIHESDTENSTTQGYPLQAINSNGTVIHHHPKTDFIVLEQARPSPSRQTTSLAPTGPTSTSTKPPSTQSKSGPQQHAPRIPPRTSSLRHAFLRRRTSTNFSKRWPSFSLSATASTTSRTKNTPLNRARTRARRQAPKAMKKEQQQQEEEARSTSKSTSLALQVPSSGRNASSERLTESGTSQPVPEGTPGGPLSRCTGERENGDAVWSTPDGDNWRRVRIRDRHGRRVDPSPVQLPRPGILKYKQDSLED